MTKLQKHRYATATHELINHTGQVMAVGTQKECFDAMVNIYGDAYAKDLAEQGVRVVRL